MSTTNLEASEFFMVNWIISKKIKDKKGNFRISIYSFRWKKITTST